MENSHHKTRPTTRFYLVAVMALVCLALGILSGMLTAIQLGFFLAILLVWSGILSKVNFRSVEAARRCPDRVFAREPFPVEVIVQPSVPGKPLLCLEYSDQLFGNGHYYSGPAASTAVQATSPLPSAVDQVPSGDGTTLQQTCTLRNRGVYSEFESRVSSRFPFGLFERTQTIEPNQGELIVYPHPEQPPVLQQLFPIGVGTGNDNDHFRRDIAGEFRGLRDYDHGDPVKLIHWPLSARHQSLVVKDFDPVAPEEVIIIFHSFWTDGLKRMTSPEYALQVLAGMFMTLHQNGTELSFYSSFTQWDELRIADDPETLDAGFEALARAEITPMNTIDPLTSLIEDLPEDDRRVIVFSNTPKRYWQHLLGHDNALICLDCRLELDLAQLSSGSRERRLQGALS
jgi:uncharacterized protein (DUF58 family)